MQSDPKSSGSRQLYHLFGGVVAFVVITLIISVVTPDLEEKEREVYELNEVSQPPPPPPERSADPEPEEPVPLSEISLEPERPEIELRPLDIALSIQASEPDITVPEILTPTLEQALAEIETILDADQLDAAPTVLPPYPEFQFPENLARRGIREGMVTMVVIIDERGRATVESFESSTHPDLRKVAMSIANQSRFTPPLYEGKEVKARYRWPLRLGAPN